jgi:hypothetical protein
LDASACTEASISATIKTTLKITLIPFLPYHTKQVLTARLGGFVLMRKGGLPLLFLCGFDRFCKCISAVFRRSVIPFPRLSVLSASRLYGSACKRIRASSALRDSGFHAWLAPLVGHPYGLY